MLKYLSLFSGIGAFESALTNLGVNYEVVNYCEIDKYASKSYSAIHGIPESKNLWDITKVNVFNLPKPNEIDLITYGFPCQDISLAGKQKGLFNDDGSLTRSGLFFEALKVIEYCKPKVAIAENVKNLTGKKFATQFETVLKSLEEAGYYNYWKVLNAKDYGIPQNRERVFIVSIRKDVDNGLFEFPEPIKCRDIRTLLDENVDESYFLPDFLIERMKIKEYKQDYRTSDTRKATTGTHEESFFVSDYRYDEGLRIRKNGCSPTITTKGKSDVVGQPIFYINKKLRYATEQEKFKLMGFTESDFEKAEVSMIEMCRNTKDSEFQKLSKQAGNSIVVDVLEELFCMMLDEKGDFYL